MIFRWKKRVVLRFQPLIFRGLASFSQGNRWVFVVYRIWFFSDRYTDDIHVDKNPSRIWFEDLFLRFLLRWWLLMKQKVSILTQNTLLSTCCCVIYRKLKEKTTSSNLWHFSRNLHPGKIHMLNPKNGGEKKHGGGWFRWWIPKMEVDFFRWVSFGKKNRWFLGEPGR